MHARGRQVQWYRHNVNRRDEATCHNDSIAAVRTKMQKEIGDRGVAADHHYRSVIEDVVCSKGGALEAGLTLLANFISPLFVECLSE